MGIGEGVNMPALTAFCGRWIPPQERYQIERTQAKALLYPLPLIHSFIIHYSFIHCRSFAVTFISGGQYFGKFITICCLDDVLFI